MTLAQFYKLLDVCIQERVLEVEICALWVPVTTEKYAVERRERIHVSMNQEDAGTY